MVNPSQIKPAMPVVCSNDVQFASVDHMEGDWIALQNDEKGNRHFIPLSWVRSIDGEVRIDRPGKQAMQQWSTTPSFDGFGSASRISTHDYEPRSISASARKRDW